MQSVKNDLLSERKTPNFGSLPLENPLTDQNHTWSDWLRSGIPQMRKIWLCSVNRWLFHVVVKYNKNVYVSIYHGMHGSACKVLRTTCSVNGKHQTLAPCPTKTLWLIKTILIQIDYVVAFHRCSKFCCDRCTGGSSTWWWNITKMCMYLYKPLM